MNCLSSILRYSFGSASLIQLFSSLAPCVATRLIFGGETTYLVVLLSDHFRSLHDVFLPRQDELQGYLLEDEMLHLDRHRQSLLLYNVWLLSTKSFIVQDNILSQFF